MDGNQNVETIHCTNCGALNNKTNSYCSNCGSRINVVPQTNSVPDESNQYSDMYNQPYNEQIVKPKKPHTELMVMLGIASVILAVIYQPLAILVLIATIASFFNEATRQYGITVLITVAVGFIAVIVLMVIVLGMCLGGLSGL